MTRRLSNTAGKQLGHRLRKQIRPWHRRIGIVGGLFLLLLTVTGILINHAADTGLTQARVRLPWLLDYYGIPLPSHSGQFGDYGITDNLLWHQGTMVLEAKHPLIAATQWRNQTIAIDAENLYLLNGDGQLIETQNKATGLPVPLKAMAIEGESQLWLSGQNGQYLADEDLIEWQSTTSFAPLHWLEGKAAERQLLEDARSAHLHWERVLLDLHAGRIFGQWGVWLWDLLALGFVFLSLSGLYIWISQQPKRK
ncbi:PepSY-associated TM helix domain-containing protein [Shewanella litorisediminis]|uniref:PepSY domain-containing protein n=1 Tax=Shewanella litorisediminis TaxID=1173586 RepID=A0ABX7G4V5_9GAMM|nr:PepSY-associated TM helix domain-containing protein [Shewanella litorisediminis]MCL2917920.1 PepSY domain-containing protein [Shewanella litorisediminis]QRH02355.1 PepSY domain-containing protein [Shewanella litorisediminis]